MAHESVRAKVFRVDADFHRMYVFIKQLPTDMGWTEEDDVKIGNVLGKLSSTGTNLMAMELSGNEDAVPVVKSMIACLSNIGIFVTHYKDGKKFSKLESKTSLLALCDEFEHLLANLKSVVDVSTPLLHRILAVLERVADAASVAGSV